MNENAIDYDNGRVVTTIAKGAWRVISCRDDIQWILQRRYKQRSAGKRPWRSVSYCRSREAIIRLSTLQGATARERAILRALPEFHP